MFEGRPQFHWELVEEYEGVQTTLSLDAVGLDRKEYHDSNYEVELTIEADGERELTVAMSRREVHALVNALGSALSLG
jgi:hypothetical protein